MVCWSTMDVPVCNSPTPLKKNLSGHPLTEDVVQVPPPQNYPTGFRGPPLKKNFPRCDRCGPDAPAPLKGGLLARWSLRIESPTEQIPVSKAGPNPRTPLFRNWHILHKGWHKGLCAGGLGFGTSPSITAHPPWKNTWIATPSPKMLCKVPLHRMVQVFFSRVWMVCWAQRIIFACTTTRLFLRQQANLKLDLPLSDSDRSKLLLKICWRYLQGSAKSWDKNC